MDRYKNWLAGSAAALALMASGHAQAQPSSAPTLRVWSGEQPWAQWNDPAAEVDYVSARPRDAVETARIEEAADRVLRQYPRTGRPFGLVGWNDPATFQPPQPGPERMIGIMIRMRADDRAFAGGCGAQGDSEYLTVPASWFDAPDSSTWISAYPELSIAMAIGWRQMRDYCADRLNLSPVPVSEARTSPVGLALNGLGGALGQSGLWGDLTRDGDSWDDQIIGRMLDRLGVSRFDDQVALASPTGLARRMGGLRPVDHPLFSVRAGSTPDSWFWYYAGWVRDWTFLEPLLASAPSDDTDSALRDWLDSALRRTSDAGIGLDRALATINWNDITANWQSDPALRGRGVFRRDVWQEAMISVNAASGCAPVSLSLEVAAVPVDLELAEAASNCIVVAWNGSPPDPELPPAFTVVARARGVDAAGLDALHLSADQNWSDTLTVERQGGVQAFDRRHQTPLIRPGIVVENTATGEATKVWEVVLRPDPAFGDDRMTLVFTNQHPDRPGSTRPMDLELTVGAGAHEARQNLSGTSLPADGDPCRDQQRLSLGVAQTYSLPVVSFHAAALDAEDFSITGQFLAAGSPDLMRQMTDCVRVQLALSQAGIGQTVSTAQAGSPDAVCAGRMAAVTGLGAQAMAAASGGGSLSGLEGLAPRQVSFSLSARTAITGPGTYAADASVSYEDLQAETRGTLLPSNDGEGTITVEEAGPGYLKVRYQARFEPQQCQAYLAGTISGELEAVVALPLAPASRRAMIAPRPIDLLGERLWVSLSASDRREMEMADRRGDPEPAPARGPSGTGGVLGTGQCALTPEEVRRLLEQYAAQVPEQVRAEMMAQILADPEAAQQLACIFRDAM